LDGGNSIELVQFIGTATGPNFNIDDFGGVHNVYRIGIIRLERFWVGRTHHSIHLLNIEFFPQETLYSRLNSSDRFQLSMALP